LKQMHIDLCALGFEGSYDRVAAFARQWKVDQLERVNSASKSTVTELCHSRITRFFKEFDRLNDMERLLIRNH
jgi:hypothetical protein